MIGSRSDGYLGSCDPWLGNPCCNCIINYNMVYTNSIYKNGIYTVYTKIQQLYSNTDEIYSIDLIYTGI